MTFRERRAWPRSRCSQGHVGCPARVRPGHDVHVLNLSCGGALIVGRRLTPGSMVELRFRGTERSFHVRGQVVRCYVSRVHADAVCYRAALAFEDRMDRTQVELWAGG